VLKNRSHNLWNFKRNKIFDFVRKKQRNSKRISCSRNALHFFETSRFSLHQKPLTYIGADSSMPPVSDRWFLTNFSIFPSGAHLPKPSFHAVQLLFYAEKRQNSNLQIGDKPLLAS